MLLLLIFPKRFEFFKFILSIEKEIRHVQEFDDSLFKLQVIRDKLLYEITCLIIDDSDIMFLLKLNRFLMNYTDRETKCLLIGTCGLRRSKKESITICLNDQKLCVGMCNYVTRALKIDRGEIMKSLFKINHKKTLIEEVMYDSCLQALVSDFRNIPETNCSNQLIISWADETEIDQLYDMETYDFFKICSQHKVTCLGALRVVSDIIGDNEGVLDRLIVDFNRVGKILLDFLQLKSEPCNFQKGVNRKDALMKYKIVYLRERCFNKISNVIPKDKLMRFIQDYRTRTGYDVERKDEIMLISDKAEIALKYMLNFIPNELRTSVYQGGGTPENDDDGDHNNPDDYSDVIECSFMFGGRLIAKEYYDA
jgi:hypothetical protein